MSIPTILTRGVSEILPSAEGLAKLMESKKIRMYLGIDPTGNQLHLGHAVVLRKLNEFAQLGHQVILLIGNGTVKIGDPTGKDKTRPVLTDEQIEENFHTWKEQAAKVLDFSKIEIRRNGDWLDSLNFVSMVKLMATTTVQQLLERDMFQDRLKNNLPIFVHELVYPLAQGYDSVAMDVDLEIGGNDQIFNMMVGRQLQRTYNNREKFVLGIPLLVGSDGRKMGKSLGNYIPLTDTPENMYGKLMGLTDQVVPEYFRLLTDVSEEKIAQFEQEIKDGKTNPMQIKKTLAFTITSWLHDAEKAKQAQDTFERVVQNKEVPENLQILEITKDSSALDAVMATQLYTSKSEARRVIEQGGVQVNEEKVIDPAAQLNLTSEKNILKVGKRAYYSINIKE